MRPHERTRPISEPEGFAAWAAKVLCLPHRCPASEHLVLRAAADDTAWQQASSEVDPRWIVFQPWREALVALVRSWEDGLTDLRREREQIVARHSLEPVKAEEIDKLGHAIGELRRLHKLSEARACAARVCQLAMTSETAEAFFEAMVLEGAALRRSLGLTCTPSAPQPNSPPCASSGSATGAAGSPTK